MSLLLRTQLGLIAVMAVGYYGCLIALAYGSDFWICSSVAAGVVAELFIFFAYLNANRKQRRQTGDLRRVRKEPSSNL